MKTWQTISRILVIFFVISVLIVCIALSSNSRKLDKDTIKELEAFIEKQETEKPDIKPIDQNIIPTHDKWKEAYGDTLETQILYNLAVIRTDQKMIFALVKKYHTTDPNEVTK